MGINDSVITVTPTSTTEYCVSVSYGGQCPSDPACQTISMNSLDVSIEVEENDTICEGESVTLTALVVYPAPGDILCTDGSIVKLQDWPVQGKTAKGIVFFVDDTKMHGYAVALTRRNSNWSNQSTTVNGLHANWRAAIRDFNGAQNTQAIRALNYPVTQNYGNVDFTQGWYLPSAGQLNLLFGTLRNVNLGLQAVGGTTITDPTGGLSNVTAQSETPGGFVFMWSSTEGNSNDKAFVLEISDGRISQVPKAYASVSGMNYYVRAIIDF
jgi:hypothetical protein